MTEHTDYRPGRTLGYAIGRTTARSLAREYEADHLEGEQIALFVQRFLSDRKALRSQIATGIIKSEGPAL